MEYKLEVLTPIIGGLSNDYFDFRIFAKIDFSDFKIIPKIKLTSEDLAGYEKELEGKDKDAVLKKLYEKKKETIEKEFIKNGYLKLAYIFPRKHYEIASIKTKEDYINWIDYHVEFSRGLVIALQKDHKIKVKIQEIKPVKINIGVSVFYYDNIKSVIAYESILPGSILSVRFDSKVDTDITVNIGGLKRFGYGRVLIKT